jgi:transcription elongation factor Elf1
MKVKQKKNKLIYCPKCDHQVVRFVGSTMVRLEQELDKPGLTATINTRFECDGCGHHYSMVTTAENIVERT